MPSKAPKPKAGTADVSEWPPMNLTEGAPFPAPDPAPKKKSTAVSTTLDVLTDIRNLLIQIEKNTSGRPG